MVLFASISLMQAARKRYLDYARAATVGGAGDFVQMPPDEEHGLYRQTSLGKREASAAARRNQDLFRRVWNATANDM